MLFPLANALFGFFENTPEFLIIESVEEGARLYTGIAPITVDNDNNEIGLNVGPGNDWNGTLDAFEGIDLNRTVLSRCSGDANSVWTSANNCQDITGFNTGGGGGGGGAVDSVVAGGNIDVNSTTGSVLVSFDDGNFLGFNNIWTATQTFNINVNVAGDVNNNSATSDANFNNLEADFFFGNFLGTIGNSADGNLLYVLLNPLNGQVISGDTDFNHLVGHTFLGHTFFLGETDDEVVVIHAADGATEHLLTVEDSDGIHLFTILPNGEIDINHMATENGEVALSILVDARGFADIVGIEIDYITGALAIENEEEIILIGIDQSLATGGEIVGYEIVPTEGDANVIALQTGILVDPLRQLSGFFADMNSAFVAGVDRRAEFIDPDSNIAMFVNDDDNVTIGNEIKFEEIEFLLATNAGGVGIKPVFEHSTGVGTFDVFNPADTTRGMRQTGVIIFDDELIPDWEVGANDEFIIRITRTQNSIPTIPVERKVQIASATEYFWNRNGSIFANDLNVSLLCIGGDCIDAWLDVNTNVGVTGIVAGGNIDVNSLTGNVKIDFDDGNFLSTAHTWSADQLYLGATFINFRGTTSGISSPISGQTEVKASSQVILQAGAQASIRAANESVTFGEGEAGVDWLWIIDGETFDFRSAWLEDEDQFQFQDDIIMQNDENFFFRDPQIGLQSSTDGQLDIYADTIVVATVPDFNTSSNTGVGGDLSVLGDSHLEGNVMAGNNVIFETNNGICGDSDATRGNGNDCNHSITFNGNAWVIQ